MQDAVLAWIVKAPAHGYELHQRLLAALGASGGAVNPGQVYVTLSRLEQGGFVRLRSTAPVGSRPRAPGSGEPQREVGPGSARRVHTAGSNLRGVAAATARAGSTSQVVLPGSRSSRRNKKVYEATPAGRARVAAWLEDCSWSKVAPIEFHLKLVAAASTGLTDPVALVQAQRRELLRQLSAAERVAAERESSDRNGGLLLDGMSLRLQADIRWLDLCEQRWTPGAQR